MTVGGPASPSRGALPPWLPVAAIVVFVVVAGAILASAGSTLGADAKAYLGAARRLIDGSPIYDLSYTQTGPPELFDYPAPFAFVALPFALLPAPFDVLVWMAGLLVAFGAGVAILPVRLEVRWVVVLLAGISWPFVYALKLGQIEPILFLLFAVGWRWRDRPLVLGTALALGTVSKLQPALLFGWALLTRRWWAVLVGGIVGAAIALVVTLLVGVGTWIDWLTLLRQVSAPITADHSFTPGAVLYQLGVSEGVASILQVGSIVTALVLVAWAALRLGPEPSYLCAVVASQLISPILWDHYAALLLLPTAWLLERGRRWAVLIPLATCVFLIWVPPAVYPLSFWVTLIALVVVGRAERDRTHPATADPMPMVAA